MATPAESLMGIELDGGWEVIERVARTSNATGGCFSVGYIVQAADGTRGFLKALDFTRIIGQRDPIAAMKEMADAFVFERAVLERCKNRRMDRVVLAIADGTLNVDGFGPYGVVQYLIFELADNDVRAQLDFAQNVDLAWTLRSLHNIAVGLFQLHSGGVAHLDIKPSNVLVYHQTISKVSDVGRAAYIGHIAPHDDATVPGDMAYAPPEFLYGHREVEWNLKNIGTDAYLLGSMIIFFFTKLSMTSLLFSELDPAHFPPGTGDYQDMLPYVRDAFGRALNTFASQVPGSVRAALTQLVRELCDPDPKLRGKFVARNSGKIFMETYVQRLNRLAYQAERGLIQV